MQTLWTILTIFLWVKYLFYDNPRYKAFIAESKRDMQRSEDEFFAFWAEYEKRAGN